MKQIRDPIHGSIEVTDAEVELVDSRFFQRLRNVRQLGFGELAFPGATHTRYAHSLGAMHLASRVVDSLFSDWRGGRQELQRLRQAVRLAILFHDVGHAPLSHASESIMPAIGALDLPEWALGEEESLDDQAAHEHYTLAILLKTEIADIIRRRFGDLGITPEAIAGLVIGRPAPGENPFQADGVDYRPLLGQIVSGELDADRMDYLLRDSFYTGANYGRYDLDWIIENVVPALTDDGRAQMAIHKRAIFAFEDFLLSRYHMFLSVYFHYTPICFDHMLRLFYEEAPDEYVLPGDPERYLDYDDIHLVSALRASRNRWARAIVHRRPWRLLLEINELDKSYDLPAIERRLADAGIEAFRVTRKGVLSKYFKQPNHSEPSLFVRDPDLDRLFPVADYTPLYEKYQAPMQILRLYCDPDQFEQGREIVASALKGVA